VRTYVPGPSTPDTTRTEATQSWLWCPRRTPTGSRRSLRIARPRLSCAPGSSAHVVLQIARHRGAEVFVATRGEEHRALARRLGAAWTAGVTDPMPGLLDSAIVFAPVGEIVPAALRAVRPGGTVALAGIHMTPIPPLDYTECLFHEKTLTSVAANTRDDGEALLREAAAVPVRPEATVFLLEAANEALAELRDGRLSGSGVLLVDPRAD